MVNMYLIYQQLYMYIITSSISYIVTAHQNERSKVHRIRR